MNLELPVVDRWQPVRTLKNDPQTRDIPIIGMSAYALESELMPESGCYCVYSIRRDGERVASSGLVLQALGQNWINSEAHGCGIEGLSKIQIAKKCIAFVRLQTPNSPTR